MQTKTNFDTTNLARYKQYIANCLMNLYKNESVLFEDDLCERCMTFRFAHHLQKELDLNEGNEYYVDCDYNSSSYYDGKKREWKKRDGKPIQNQVDGEIKKRFIDIIIHKRICGWGSDLICFEIKKWNNCTIQGIEKDENNLKVLTEYYGYEFGFHLLFGKEEMDTQLAIFHNGQKIDE